MSDTSPRNGLRDRIREEIRSSGPISFARFMELALYHPDDGYYSRGAAIGREGADFWTAPEISPAFGELIGAQLAEMAVRLGRPEEFRVVEFGAGTGSLAGALLDWWREHEPGLYRPGGYGIVETSPALATRQTERLAVHEGVVAWLDPGKIEARPGVLLMNEVLDALPVRRVRRTSEGLCEIRVDLDGDDLIEIDVPASGTLVEELRRALPEGQHDLDEGQEAEVRPTYRPFLGQSSRYLTDGYFLAIDYGLTARELYAPMRRRGTTMAYYRHRADENLLARPGEQDLTAHVDLDLLQRECARLGFEALSTVTQMRFLIALGLEDKMLALEEGGANEKSRVEQRLAIAALVRPGGMGEMFRVFIAGRGAAGPLRGLRDPLAAPSADGSLLSAG